MGAFGYKEEAPHFPFENPHEPQSVLMTCMSDAIKKKENALLEAPPGSGKIAGILWSALGTKHMMEEKFKIVYVARYESTLIQVIKELDKLGLNPNCALCLPKCKMDADTMPPMAENETDIEDYEWKEESQR